MRPGLCPGPTGEAYRAPKPPSWFSGSHFASGERRKGEGKGEKEEKGRGSVPPLFII